MFVCGNIKRNYNQDEIRKFNDGEKVPRHLNIRYLHKAEIYQLLRDFYRQSFENWQFNPNSNSWSCLFPSIENGRPEWQWKNCGGSWSVAGYLTELIYDQFKIQIVGSRTEDELHCDLARLVRCIESNDFLNYLVELVKENFYCCDDSEVSSPNRELVIPPMEDFGLSNSMPVAKNHVVVD